jgi:hypothetical protein
MGRKKRQDAGGKIQDTRYRLEGPWTMEEDRGWETGDRDIQFGIEVDGTLGG